MNTVRHRSNMLWYIEDKIWCKKVATGHNWCNRFSHFQYFLLNNFEATSKKSMFLYALKCPLQKFLMLFYPQNNFEFWTFWTRRFHSGSVCNGSGLLVKEEHSILIIYYGISNLTFCKIPMNVYWNFFDSACTDRNSS